MTGFGTGEAALSPGKLVLDARSVNHRYLDVRVRLPQELVDQSLYLEQRARERLSRGRFDLSVRYEGPPVASRLDVERARSVYRELERLRDELSPGAELPFAAIIGMPELFAPGASHDVEKAQAALDAALTSALTRLDAMRETEGSVLAAEIGSRIATCRGLRAKIEARVPESVRGAETRLRARVARLTTDAAVTVEQGRIEAEIVLLADRADVTEELVRLGSHFTQLEGLLLTNEPTGRRVDFLLQEVAREANTIGAKSQDAELGHLVVELKTEIERMREQVQNVE